MGKPQSKRDQQCILMSGKLSRALQEQITKKKCGFNLANYNVHSSVSEFSICCFDSSNKAGEIPLKVELPPQKMPVGTSNPHNILLNSQVLNCCDGLSKSTNSAGDTNDDNCNKIEPFECELQVDTSSEKKQDWSFTLYDFDGKGKITKEELGNLFQALYDAVGSSIRLPLNGTKKLKLRLSIGHDHSHLDTTLKDQSPPLVKKKAKLKNSSRLTEWKEMSLQAGAGGSTGVGMVDPKECTKLNNLDASPRAKPSTMSKMENQLTATTPGIGHRLMLSCREQRKLTEMVHENMVRNHVRQQTGRKHHHSGHRHHHHHREARRHRSTRRQGDENRKPREKERTYYLDLGNIERSAPPNGVSLPYSAGIPTTSSTTTATVTTSVMTFARPTIINIVPSSSSPPPPPPPPPTASGSTAHCNEIGMAADDDNDSSDDVIRLEAGGKGNRRKYDNTWRETGLEEPANGHGNSTTTTGQQDHHNHPHHPHHHHHHHNRRRHHPHRNTGEGGHVKCKHCNEKCAPLNSETVKASMNGATESENANKNDKKEILNRRHKQNNNYSTNINNDTNSTNEINNNNNNNNTKDVSNKNTNRELVMASGGDMTKQDNPSATYKCHNSDANLKASFDCICSRCQKMSCRLRVNYTGSWQLNSENIHDLQQRNTNASADGRETTAGISTLTSADTITTTTATTTTAASTQCDKKTSDRSGKRTGEERHKKHSESYHHAHIGRTLSQERGGHSGPAVTAPVSSSVSAVTSKMTTPGGIPGAMAERKSLRTHYKTDASTQQNPSRHRAHCQNTLVPEKHAGTQPSALLPSSVSPPPPTPNTAVATTTSTTATMAATTATTTTTTSTLQQQQQQPHHHHHHHHHLRRRNQTSRNMEFNEAMQQVADWINREHNHQQKGPSHSHQGSVNAEHFVHVQRHEHHHVHEYHHHHHYHHYYQT